MLLCDTVHQTSLRESAADGLTTGQPRPLTHWGISGGPYHVTTRLNFYHMMSKIHDTINKYWWIWRCLTCPTQGFGNVYCFECDVIMVWQCEVTVVVLETMVCSWRQLITSTAVLSLLTTWFDCGKRVIGKFRKADHGLAVGHIGVYLIKG